MEPANLNPPPSEDDQLATLLRANSPAVPDDGFSARVLTALPPPREARWTKLQIIAGAVGALAGLGFALLKGASWSDGLEVAGRGIDACAVLFSDPWFAFALGLTVMSLLIPYLLSRPTGVEGLLKRPLGNGRF